MKTRLNFIAVPGISPLLLVIGLALGPILMSGQADEAPAAGDPLQQGADDLLAGVHWAICYSGFRRGQHPDRGKGAVNPSDEEVLEDLQMLHRDGEFKLIRLYDARDNSAAVLRLIREHDLGMKVLLGAWLDAEVNNPACPWRSEPYPDEVLAANKRKNGQEIWRRS